jgi:hypothetical protein
MGRPVILVCWEFPVHKKDFLKDLFDRSTYNNVGGKL